MSTDSDNLTSSAIACGQCRKSNSNERKFCSECGASLWTKCGKCDSAVSVSERFCGACGENLEAIRQNRVTAFQEAVAEAESLAEQHQYEEAVSRLRQVIRKAPLELRHDADRLQPKLDAWSAEMVKSQDSMAAKLTQAELALEQCDYEVAASLLMSIPEASRTDQTRDTLSRARRAIVEIKQLQERIKTAVIAKKHLLLLPDLDRLLQLKPNDLKSRKMAEEIRDKLLVIAKRYLDEAKFEEAWKAASRILPFVMNANAEKLIHVIEARCWLIRDLQRATHVDRTLVDVASRLQKSAPEHPIVRKLAPEVLRRAKKLNEPSPPRPMRWANDAATSAALSKVEYFPWHEAFAGGDRLPAAGGYHGCRFAVAVGLALQGIGLAAVKTDLNRNAKTSWIDKVKALSKKDAGQSFGLHIGSSSLKAVRLSLSGKDAKPEIVEAHLIPFGRSLSSVTSDFERRDLIRNALIEAKQRCDFGNVPLVMSNAAIPILARFVDLPPVDEKKVKVAVEKEAAHQIPFSLSEVHWDSHIFKSNAESTRRQLLLLALKKAELMTFLEMAETLGIQIAACQSDGVALHNLIEFSRQNNPLQKAIAPSEDSTVAVLHAGGDGSTLVLSRPDRLWFRYFSQGGTRLSLALAVEFKVTQEQAEGIKLHPVRQSEVHRVYRSLQRPLREFRYEIERSIEASQRDAGMTPASVLQLTGGATQLHGFCRMIQAGPESLIVGDSDQRGSQSTDTIIHE